MLPGVQIKVGLGASNEKYVLVLASENGALLAEHARTVERELRTIPGIGAVTTTASLVRPELVVRPDFARMADLGVTSATIADTLRIATAGDYRPEHRQAQPDAAADSHRRQAAAGSAPGFTPAGAA